MPVHWVLLPRPVCHPLPSSRSGGGEFETITDTGTAWRPAWPTRTSEKAACPQTAETSAPPPLSRCRPRSPRCRWSARSRSAPKTHDVFHDAPPWARQGTAASPVRRDLICVYPPYKHLFGEVLQRPIETTQYASHDSRAVRAANGAIPGMRRAGIVGTTRWPRVASRPSITNCSARPALPHTARHSARSPTSSTSGAIRCIGTRRSALSVPCSTNSSSVRRRERHKPRVRFSGSRPAFPEQLLKYLSDIRHLWSNHDGRVVVLRSAYI